MDNNYYNLNFPKKYLSCLVIYEKITQYKILQKEYIKMSSELTGQTNVNLISEQSEYLYNNNNDIIKDENIFIPKCLVIMSLYPYFSEFERILNEIHYYSLGITFESKEKKKAEHGIICFREQPNNSRQTFNPINTKIMNPPTTKRMDKKKITIPVDKIIENLVIELPVPPRGIYRLEYSLNYHKRKLHQNEMNQLPYVDINLKKIFSDFDVKSIISIYRHLFLETRLLFFSENIELLNIYIFSFLSFLYPFDYQYQIVTILPKENFEIMESITPFIAGINERYTEDFFDRLNLTLSDTVLIIDIDNKITNLVNDQGEIPTFPKINRKLLEKNLTNILNNYMKDEIPIIKTTERKTVKSKTVRKDKPSDLEELKKQFTFKEEDFDSNNNIEDFNNTNQEIFDFEEKNNINIRFNMNNYNIDYNFNTEIGEAFFNFNAKLLSNYSKYLNLEFYSSNSAPSLELLFKVNQYLKEFSNSNDRNFYNKFITETQIFGDFIFMRMIPKSSKEKIQILSFDEKINENSTKYFSHPLPSVFSKSTEYKFNIDIVIQKPRELSVLEKDFYNQTKNKLELILYGIITEKSKDNTILFKYPIFPKLVADIFFKYD